MDWDTVSKTSRNVIRFAARSTFFKEAALEADLSPRKAPVIVSVGDLANLFSMSSFVVNCHVFSHEVLEKIDL